MNKAFVLLIVLFVLFINISIVNASQSTYNPATGMCEQFPVKVIVCSDPLAAYNASLDKCIRTYDTDAVFNCKGVLNKEAKTCTITVNQTIIVNPVIDCKGTWNEAKRTCTQDVPVQPICSKGVLSQSKSGVYSCIFEPDIENKCTAGSYDKERNACVIEPNLKYLCTRGLLSSDEKSCLITPDEKFECPAGSTLKDTDACVKTGDVSRGIGLPLILALLAIVVVLVITVIVLIARAKIRR